MIVMIMDIVLTDLVIVELVGVGYLAQIKFVQIIVQEMENVFKELVIVNTTSMEVIAHC
jgi:hypothetical protein